MNRDRWDPDNFRFVRTTGLRKWHFEPQPKWYDRLAPILVVLVPAVGVALALIRQW